MSETEKLAVRGCSIIEKDSGQIVAVGCRGYDREELERLCLCVNTHDALLEQHDELAKQFEEMKRELWPPAKCYKRICETLGIEKDILGYIENINKQRDALLAACELTEKRLLTHGEWDDNCFYYAGHSASELEEPLRKLKAAIAAAGEK